LWTRVAGSLMTGASVALLLILHATALAPVALAQVCCEECDEKSAACWAACDAMSHDAGGSDSVQECRDDCDADLMEHCYLHNHCRWCFMDSPPTPAPTCASCIIQHESTAYCYPTPPLGYHCEVHQSYAHVFMCFPC